MRCPSPIVAVLFGSLTIFGSFAACKPKAPVASDTKDFAFKGDAKNFTIIAGHRPTDPDGIRSDVANWNNLMTRGQLGRYEVLLSSPTATVADVREAFKKAGESVADDSTVVFAFSGRRANDTLEFSDGRIGLAELRSTLENAAKSKGRTKIARFYAFVDAAPAGAAGDEVVIPQAATNSVPTGLFQQVIEFDARSPDMKPGSVSYDGRLAFEFIRQLDLYVAAFKQENAGTNPTLKTAFDTVILRTDKTGGARATYRLNPQALGTETLFSKVTGVTPIREPGAPASTTPVGAISSNSLALTDASGQNVTLGSLAKTYTLVDVSTDWCGPCQTFAEDLARAAAAMNTTNCALITIIPADSGSSLGGWNEATKDIVKAHSYGFAGTSQDLSTKLPFQVSYFPTVVLLDKEGAIAASDSGQALDDFREKCGR